MRAIIALVSLMVYPALSFAANTTSSHVNDQAHVSLIAHAGFYIALVTLLWKVFEFIVNRFDKALSKRSEKTHKLWFDNVLIPYCINPLLNFIEVQAKNLSSMHSRGAPSNASLNNYRKMFSIGKNKIIRNFLLVDGAIYKNITEKIDEIEDVVTKHCAANALGGGLFQEYKNYESVSPEFYLKGKELLDIILDTYLSKSSH